MSCRFSMAIRGDAILIILLCACHSTGPFVIDRPCTSIKLFSVIISFCDECDQVQPTVVLWPMCHELSGSSELPVVRTEFLLKIRHSSNECAVSIRRQSKSDPVRQRPMLVQGTRVLLIKVLMTEHINLDSVFGVRPQFRAKVRVSSSCCRAIFLASRSSRRADGGELTQRQNMLRNIRICGKECIVVNLPMNYGLGEDHDLLSPSAPNEADCSSTSGEPIPQRLPLHQVAT